MNADFFGISHESWVCIFSLVVVVQIVLIIAGIIAMVLKETKTK